MINVKSFSLTIDEKLNNKNVGYVLSKELMLSKGIIIDLKKGDYIKLNGIHCTVRAIVKTGDIFTVNIPEMQKNDITPIEGELDILYEDEDILAVNKPFNMPTHPVRHHQTDTLANIVCNYLGSDFVFRSITRLDRDTTGVVLIAKNRYSAELLNRQMRSGSIKKEYYGICIGEILEGGEIDVPIKRETERGIKRIPHPDGKAAKTLYSPVSPHPYGTLVKLIPITGRTHQLRVHLSYVGHPLYGDYIYGENQGSERFLLHCKKLELTQLNSNEKLIIEAPFPADFKLDTI